MDASRGIDVPGWGCRTNKGDVQDARTLVKASPGRTGKQWSWINGLRARRPFNVVVAALAHQLARILWAMLSRGELYRAA
jgi:hypothetical protein